ncbi:class I SAM-dependent methyltransferase [Sphingomonas agri]|uniref:class I SAM-dependent methyltransferase n=1 Tax=Sphingomonas agri TaxID=1813878 RepID=UPI00311D9E0B
MNLVYLIANHNERFARSRKVGKMRLEHNGLTWRGVKLDVDGGSIYVERATECQPFRSRAASIGWYAKGLHGDTEVAVRFLSNGKTVSKRRLKVHDRGFEPIVLPWPVDPVALPLDLEIYCSGPSPVFIASHFDLDRSLLFGRCKGRGVELGPGPNPHIHPSDETDVLYVEQKPAEEWVQLYGEHYKMKFDPALEPLYIVGEAHEIPVAPESLDFIYSSHVFEHLVNPIGHLERWSKLLRKGGEVMMVVPDYIGSKDYLADPTSMAEMMEEFRDGGFAPSFSHYERYGHARSSPDKAQKLFDSKSSIHMHYYTNDNMRELLEFSVSQGHFSKYTIIHSRNAKDFHVIASK